MIRFRSIYGTIQNRLPDMEDMWSSCWTWLAFGSLLLAAVQIIASPEDQPARQSHTTSSPGISEPALSSGTPRSPRIAPDYTEVVIPPNLAPMNLAIQEPGTEYQIRLTGSRGQPLELRQSDPRIRFPPGEWKEILGTNRGGALRWNISVRNTAGEWTSYSPFENRVAEEDIDPYIIYRRLRPLYSSYKHLGIYQRNLETFEEKPVLRNSAIDHGCVNCHTFVQGAPDRFAISLRGRFGTPTFLIDSNRISRIDTKMGYLSWHPSGKLLVYSANAISQFFHIAGPINRDINDPRSDLAIFHLSSRTIEKPAAIAVPDRNENWPCWAPDGHYLYYCSAPAVALRDIPNLRYDLLRVSYDPDQNRWGTPETLVSGVEHRMSMHQPRPSPDGHHLALTASDTGSFPLFRPASDLFLLNLESRKLERLPINSDHAETWHCWSSNGRWFVFGSRGLDGVFARILISHVTPGAQFSKPLLMPQEDPAYYDTCLDNFNVPELARGPIRISEEELARAYKTPQNTIEPAEQGPSAPGRAPGQNKVSDNPYE